MGFHAFPNHVWYPRPSLKDDTADKGGVLCSLIIGGFRVSGTADQRPLGRACVIQGLAEGSTVFLVWGFEEARPSQAHPFVWAVNPTRSPKQVAFQMVPLESPVLPTATCLCMFCCQEGTLIE